jgi:pilus assembly protein CpaE
LALPNSFIDTTPAPQPVALGPDADRKIVTFVQDEESTAALRGALARFANDLDIRRGGLRHAIRFFEREPAPRMAVVDITGEADPQGGLDELARVCPPFVPVVVVGENNDIEFYRQLINDLGVAEYLHKPLTRDLIQRLLLPRLEGTAAATTGLRGGHIVAVCGARGGAGATTIAIGLASEIAEATKAHVALLDLNLQNGTAALMLGTNPGPGLRSALGDPQRADALLLERAAVEVAPRLRLLAAEEGFSSNAPVTEEGVTRVFELLSQKFNYIIVDLPIPVPDNMAWAIKAARQIVVVFGPDIAGLRDAKALRNLVTIATGSDRVISVLNRGDQRGGLSRALVETGLGATTEIVIPDFGKAMLQAVNLGVPAVRHVPSLRRHLAPLVREIAGVRTDRASNSWVKRILRR